MGVLGAIGKFALKGAAKVGLGASTGGPLGTAIGVGSLLLDVAPLIQDLASNGSDPEKIAKLKAVRDDMAQKLVQSKGIPMDQALAEVNDQMKPLIDDANKGEGRGPGGTLLDAVSVGTGLYMGSKAGLFGKGKKAAGAAGAAETAAAKELTPEVERFDTNYKAPSRAAAERGSMDSVTPGSSSRGGMLPAPEGVMEREAQVVPPDGGTMPMSLSELKAMMMRAVIREQAKAPPGAFRPKPLALGNTIGAAVEQGAGDREFMRDLGYDTDPRLEDIARQMRVMRALRDKQVAEGQ